MRNAVNQASNATTTAANTGANLGGAASAISGNLTPFLTQELEHPQGYSPQDTSAMLAAGMGGAGGATSSIAGDATNMAARSGNAGSYQSVLDDAARQRAKANAGTAEGIASQNAQLKQQQQQDASKQLEGLHGTDTSGMLDATGQEARDIGAGVEANNSGWLQNTMNVIKTLGGAAAAFKG